MLRALRQHWPEYLMEAVLLGAFMFSACLVGALLEHPDSPVRQALPNGFVRRALAGLAMAATALCIFYSAWGKQSGAHINPCVTLTFLRLGRVNPSDATFYVLAQFAGGTLGVVLSAALLPASIAHPSINYAVTVPGPGGAAVAFAAEAFISFVMMTVVLNASSHPQLGSLTGLCAAALVFVFITFEAPLSGMSMNPARTFASALPAGEWTSIWVYFLGPAVGMLGAAQAWLIYGRRDHCAKLHHQNDRRCIFCLDRSAARTRPQTDLEATWTATTS